MLINNVGHKTKMAPMPIYILKKPFFSGIDGQISTKHFGI